MIYHIYDFMRQANWETRFVALLCTVKPLYSLTIKTKLKMGEHVQQCGCKVSLPFVSNPI